MNFRNGFVFILISVAAVVQLPFVAQSSNNISRSEVQRVKQNSSSYIGLRYRNLPRGVQGLGGWTIGDGMTAKYAVANVRRGDQQLLWFETLVSRDSQGKATYQVIDVLKLPRLGNLDQLSSDCQLNGVRDPEVIAIAKYQDTEYWRQIKRAWRANRRSGKFQEIAPRNIACENPGWGL